MEKCVRCKLPGGNRNFHICVDLTYRAPGEARMQHGLLARARRNKRRTRRSNDSDARGGWHNFGSQFARPYATGPDINEYALTGD